MNNVKIKSFISKNGETKINFNHDVTVEDVQQTVEEKTTQGFRIHLDLHHQLQSLKRHMMVLTEQENEEIMYGEDDKTLSKYAIYGFELKQRKEGYVQIKIIGSKILKDLSEMKLETKPIILDRDSGTQTYKFIDELIDLVMNLETEVVAYLNGKYSHVGAQTSMQF